MKILYRDLRAYKYQLALDAAVKTGLYPIGPAIFTEYIDLLPDGTLVVRNGYAWDGPSGPAIDTKSFMRGSLFHDAAYQLIRMGLLPKARRGDADRLLYTLCREDKMSAVRAAWVYTSVRSMGWTACTPRPEDRAVLVEAP